MNGNSTTSTKRTSQIGGALIGGLAMGGVGALIGGLSGEQVTTQNTETIDLRLTVNNISKPTWEIRLYGWHNKKWTTPDLVMNEARKWHGLVSVLIKRADQEDQAISPLPLKNTPDPLPIVTSIADELAKLGALREQGLITQDEFDEQKRKLLA